MPGADDAPQAVLVQWATVDRQNADVSRGRAVVGRGCARCALDVGMSAIGTPQLLDPDEADDLLRHAPDCGLLAIEDAAEAAGGNPTTAETGHSDFVTTGACKRSCRGRRPIGDG
ncbi:MAG TPA: hypothetical protein VHC18_03290 [Amycolatopsis sp.]|jgi:hypothetical protein|nr:hypothetical protein [Amycolatopsis sp.]